MAKAKSAAKLPIIQKAVNGFLVSVATKGATGQFELPQPTAKQSGLYVMIGGVALLIAAVAVWMAGR